jgi:single-strand DNA-binding protein
LAGNLTRDPILRYLPSQAAVVEFGIATNRKYKTAQGEEREDVCFVDCTAFGKTGEIINQHFTKGKAIFVEGRLTFQSWEDKNGGGKRSKLLVTVDSFQFVGGRVDGGGDRSEPEQRPPLRRPEKKPVENPIDGEAKFTETDIPFPAAH